MIFYLILLISILHPVISSHVPQKFNIVALFIIAAADCILYLTSFRGGYRLKLGRYLKTLLTQPSGPFLKEFATFFSIISQITWAVDSIRDFSLFVVSEGTFTGSPTPDSHLIILGYSVLFLIFVPLSYINFFVTPQKKTEKIGKPSPRKILFIALSDPKRGENNYPDNQIQRLKEKLNSLNLSNLEKPSEEMFKDLRGNWTPALRAVLHENEHLEKVFVLLSNEVKDYFGNFLEFLKVIPFLKSRIDRKELDIIPLGPCDFNEFKEVHRRLNDGLDKVKNYHDEDISFNITGGTAAVSVAMIIEAVYEKRQAEYIRQDNKELVGISITRHDLPYVVE